MTNFTEKIRLLRLKKGFSQENMAEMLGISTTSYGDLERGKTELTVSRLLKIALVLEVGLTQILENSSQNNTLEILKLKAEKERFEFEAMYWREKYEAIQTLKTNETQSNRPHIGFMKAS